MPCYQQLMRSRQARAARFLLDRGVNTTILDPSSFLVSRCGRRVKTDRVDVLAIVFTVKAYMLGDKSVCRAVRLLTSEEVYGKRLARERPQLKKERTCHINRILALLTLQGIRSVRGLWGGRWKNWLSSICIGDGRVLNPFFLRELFRQFERLELVHTQLEALVKERVMTCSTEGAINNRQKISTLKQLVGVSETGAAQLVTEVFYRTFKNRRHPASYLGLAPRPYSTGEKSRFGMNSHCRYAKS